jgi:nitrous oxide reductase accessory protein NosL
MERRGLIFLALTALLAACSASGPAFKPVPPPRSDQAIVYLYRPSTMEMNGRTAFFQIDGRPMEVSTTRATPSCI